MGPAFEPVVSREEDFAPPDGSVGAVPRAVEGEADHPLAGRNPVLSHHGGDVRVMVLDQLHRLFRVLVRPPSGLITGMPIGGKLPGSDLVHVGELSRRSFERGQRLHAAHVADVLAHEGVAARCEAEGVLELPPMARTGSTVNGSRTGRGAYPRDRRIGSSSPSSTRTTESSHGT